MEVLEEKVVQEDTIIVLQMILHMVVVLVLRELQVQQVLQVLQVLQVQSKH